MATSFPPRVGTVFADRYQLRELLGSGGVGQVFRAWDLQSQRLVGLKVYNPAAVSPSTWAAYAELVANAARLRHPDLVLPQGLPPTLPDQKFPPASRELLRLSYAPVVRQAAVASSFGIRFQGLGQFLTDGRTHRGTSGAPVVMRWTGAPSEHQGLPWKLLGVHSARMDMGGRDLVEDESLGLNCAWYADILKTLTDGAASPPATAARPGPAGRVAGATVDRAAEGAAAAATAAATTRRCRSAGSNATWVTRRWSRAGPCRRPQRIRPPAMWRWWAAGRRGCRPPTSCAAWATA